MTKIGYAILIAVIISTNVFQAGAALEDDGPPPDKGGTERGYNPETGRVAFIGSDSPIHVQGSSGVRTASPQNKAMLALETYGPEFGLQNPAGELQVRKTRTDENGRTVTRYQQVYRGIPIFAGELIVNMNENGDLLSMSGEVSPELSVSVSPTIYATEASQAALDAIAKWHKLDQAELVVSEPELWIFDESLLKESLRTPELVWRMEVSATDVNQPVRELVLVNAQTGGISLHYNQMHAAWSGSAERSELQQTGTTWYVATTGDDTNDCQTTSTPCETINGAIGKASNGDTIYVASGTYTSSGLSVVSVIKDITLSGGWDSSFTTQNGQTVIDGENVREGISVSNYRTATISDIFIKNSTTGIDNHGNLTINKTAILQNKLGVHNLTPGGITIKNSTISGNSRTGNGGGIQNYAGYITVANSTITNNHATEGGGVYDDSGYITFQNSIVSGNTATESDSNDCFRRYGSGTFYSNGNNIVGTGCIITYSHPSDQKGANPNLSVLLDNGTHTPLPWSPAIDAGNPATPGSGGDSCESDDQIGTVRPVDGDHDSIAVCDIGAIEYGPTGITPTDLIIYQGDQQQVLRGTSAPIYFGVFVMDANSRPVPGVTVTFTAPASGASGTFSDSSTNSTSKITDSDGLAIASEYSTNSTIGQYVVEASVSGISSPAIFNFENLGKFRVYSMDSDNNTDNLPGQFVCDESQPDCTGGTDNDADNSLAYSIDTFQFYANHHGRDSIDNDGMAIISSVHFGTDYQNAFWSGSQMVYGDDFVADDITAHELTHGVTDYESNLIYLYQSGAISESFSDLWGEFVDQTNGSGNDAANVKWLIGEDLPIGAVRDMSNPPAYDQPDKITSSYFYEGFDDRGGVHINSGVNNKAVYLMTDGGSFNGKTVTGIGMEKTVAIYYEVQTNLLGAAANYTDLYYAINQACSNLIGGTEGITSSDCIQVQNAIQSVEMNFNTSFVTPMPDACPTGWAEDALFFDDMESGLDNWTLINSSYEEWTLEPYGLANPGHSLFGESDPFIMDSSAVMNSDVTLPAGSSYKLFFKHYFELEAYYDQNYNIIESYDGAVLEYSTDQGGTWTDARVLFSAGQDYNSTLETYWGNPLGGRTAFSGSSFGTVGSIYNLSALAGKNVRFRWRIGTDNQVQWIGWFIDDVKIYNCIPIPDTTAPADITTLSAATGTTTGTVDLSWTAVGDDGGTGTATSYLVRYSTSAINDETDWNNATVFANSLTPQEAGQTENLTVTWLTPGTTYFFAVRAQDEKPNLGGLSNSPSAAAKDPPPPVGAGTYDDTDAAWVYNGSWSTYSGAGPYNNTLHYTSTVGDYAEITFTGTQFTLKYTQYTNRGLIDVHVDGVKVDTINANGTTTWQKTWTSASYPNGDHTVYFVHAGGGAIIDIDVIEIFGPDVTAPAAISDLNAVTGVAGGSVDLSWTAVGDDGGTGTATSYLVRYSTSAINNETDWNNATVFANSLTPQEAGQTENLEVTGLTPGTTYFFAVRAQDEKPNLGDLSNSPSAAAKIPPPPVGAGTYDDTDAAWMYSGAWSAYNGAGPYNNSMHYTSTVGDYAELIFSGTQFTLTYMQNTNRGLLDVYVDGVKVDTINAYGTTTWQKTWTSASYANGVHTVRFVHAGGSTYVDIDAIEIIAPDLTAPAAITTLNAVTGSTSGSVDLGWTAVGDDGSTGTASSYLVRYSTSAINNETDWNNATLFPNSLTPSPAGAAESLTVTGLTPGSTYFFAVRAQDEVPNLGDLSNSPSAEANLTPPSGTGLYDDTDTAWFYSSGWTAYSGAGPYNNSMHYTSTPGSYAEFTFEGTQFILTFAKYSNRGLIYVFVDGVKVDTINPYASSMLWQSTWSSSTLSNGTHTVRFVHAGGGTYIDIDAIEILGPDTTAPAPIDDLQAVAASCGGGVNLSWTAVGDDGTNGTASAYLVRYSTSAITNTTAWDNATPVPSDIPTPKAAGQSESMSVSGLTAGQTYYFAVRAQDEVPNIGAVSSNSPNAQSSSATVVNPGTYDDTHAAWCYNGPWTTYSGSGPFNNSMHYTSTPGSQAEITFTGTQFKLKYTQNTNRGKIDVFVDGVKVDTINAYGSLTWQKSWTSATYALGEHTVRFVHAGGGTYVDVDAIEVLGPDVTAPAPIIDLSAVTGVAGGSVDLSWTAVGDDGGTGTATSYLVRYSTSAINNETDWNNATVFANTLTPKVAGGAESLTVTGLTPGTTYFFAVRAQDEKPNLGGLSNSPSAAAKVPPPPVGAGTYDDTDAAWRYNGAWSAYNGAGPYNNTLHYTSTPGSQAEITFTGTQFALKYLQNTNRGLLDVYLDDVKVNTINANGTTTWQKTWTSASYLNGDHTVRFVHAGGGTYVDIDAIEILGPDTTAPAAITTLNAATGSTSGSVDLSWTAVGDDGNNGTASAYLVRYSTSAINNDTDWNNATAFANSLTPKAAGGAESLTVTGLTPGTTYFFAIRAQDEIPNLGGLSNSPSAAAKVPPPPVGAGTYDDTDAAWTYSGSWSAYNGTGPYNNTLHYASTPGSQAEITFTGTQFKLKYLQNTNRGSLDVYLDGVKVDTINANGPTTWQKTWTSASYPNGDHTVRFVHAGGGTYVDVDAIEIVAPLDTVGINITTSPNPIGMASGTYREITFVFTETNGEAGSLTSRTSRFYTQDGTPLSNSIGPYPTYINIQANGTSDWTDNIYLPPEVVNNARASNEYAVVLKTTFEGTSTSGAALSVQASLLIIIPPDDFSKISPSSGADDQPINLTLDWDSSIGAIHYEVCYDTINNNACDNENGWLGTYETSKLLNNLSPETTYYWQARAVNTAGKTVADSGDWWFFTTEQAASPVGAGTYDDTDAAWMYSGAWSAYSGAGPYNNSLHYTGTVGNHAEITFTGTQFTLKYTQNTNRGKIDVYVDGVKVATINAYGSLTWQKSWTSASYALGDHTVRFVHAGGGTYVDIDAIEILP